MIWPVVAYAPTAATKPSIAAQPLNFSASGVIVLIVVIVYKLSLESEDTKEEETSAWNVRDETCYKTKHSKTTI